MASEDITIDIINLCRSIDGKSNIIYSLLSENTEDENIKMSLQQMAEDEKEILKSWQSLLDLIKDANIQPVFDAPEELKKELESILDDVEKLINDSSTPLDLNASFLIMCTLEFAMINRSLINLYSYIDSICSEANFMENNERHIERFVSLLHSKVSSKELKSLGKILLRVWTDNKHYVRLCNFDYLTNVYNRRGFYQIIKPLAYSCQRSGNNAAIMMIDGDNFKKVNDTYGHHAGDEVLIFIASSIQEHTRQSDLVGRYGGEEFLVFLSDVQPDQLYNIAENIRKQIEEKSRAYIPVTVSIGLSQRIFEKNVEEELSELINEADGWMMKAKTSGKNRIMGQPLKSAMEA